MVFEEDGEELPAEWPLFDPRAVTEPLLAQLRHADAQDLRRGLAQVPEGGIWQTPTRVVKEEENTNGGEGGNETKPAFGHPPRTTPSAVR